MLTDTQPNTPAGWQTYASLREVTEIPATADASRNESGVSIGILFDSLSADVGG